MNRPAWILAVALVTAAHLNAQSVRVSGSTHMRYIELRPLVADSLALDQLPGDGLLRQAADGRVLRCIPGETFCYDVRPGARVSTIPVIHDVELSAWGLARGLSAFAQLRARNALRTPELWPRGDDAFDVLAAYAELTRERLRMRAGRQWKVSGLGFYNFDGLAIEARPNAAISVEVYGGRSLLRGLNESRTGSALESIEALAPPAAGLLLGAHARYQRNRTLGIGAVYQVDFRDDGGGLYSELFAADATLSLRSIALEAALELDVATTEMNEARVRVRPPPFGSVALHAELRRYRPYFELWTIWGAFSPVGFDEARAGLTWAQRDGKLMVQTDATYRSYGSTETEDGLADFRESGWGTGISINWLPTQQWRFDAGYRMETGVGAARREGHAGLQRMLGDRATVAVQALAFERLYEFRLDNGTVLGLSAEASMELSARVRVIASGTTYHHLRAAESSSGDWNQRRAGVRLHWTVGPEPGMPKMASQ